MATSCARRRRSVTASAVSFCQRRWAARRVQGFTRRSAGARGARAREAALGEPGLRNRQALRHAVPRRDDRGAGGIVDRKRRRTSTLRLARRARSTSSITWPSLNSSSANTVRSSFACSTRASEPLKSKRLVISLLVCSTAFQRNRPDLAERRRSVRLEVALLDHPRPALGLAPEEGIELPGRAGSDEHTDLREPVDHLGRLERLADFAVQAPDGFTGRPPSSERALRWAREQRTSKAARRARPPRRDA